MAGFVFGDSYGGVQGAAQTADNSDRQFALSLIAAQQQAQKMAMDQQLQQAQLRNLALQPSQDQEKDAESARRFDLQLGETQQDRELRKQLGLDAIDERYAALNDHTAAIDRQTQLIQNSAKEVGAPLANSFGTALQTKTTADQDLADAVAAKEKLMSDINDGVANQSLIFDAKKGKVTPLKDDPAYRDYAAKLTDSLLEHSDNIKAAEAKAKNAERGIALATAALHGGGFTPDMESGTIIHARTGQTFSFANSTPISQPKGAARLPIAPPANTAVQSLPWYNPRRYFSATPGANVSPMLPQPVIRTYDRNTGLSPLPRSVWPPNAD